MLTGRNWDPITVEHDQEVHEQRQVQVNVMVMKDDECIAYIEILEMPNLPENLVPSADLEESPR